MVGQGSEGSERKVRDHGAEGRRDFAIEVGVFGKETLIAKCFKTIQDGREAQDGIELGIIKNPERLLCAHAGRAEERVLACGGGVIQDSLDDGDGAAAGDRTWLTGRGAHEIANRFLDFIAGVAGQLAEYGSGGSGGTCVGQQDTMLEMVLVAFVEIIGEALRLGGEVDLGDAMLAAISHEFIKNILWDIGMCKNSIFGSRVRKLCQIG